MWNTDVETSRSSLLLLRTLVASCPPTPTCLAYCETPGVEDQIGFCLQLLDAVIMLSTVVHSPMMLRQEQIMHIIFHCYINFPV